MKLHTVLLKYCNKFQTEAVIQLLKKHGLFESLQASANRYYAGAPSPSETSPATEFMLLMHAYMSVTYTVFDTCKAKKVAPENRKTLLAAIACLIDDAKSRTCMDEPTFKTIFWNAHNCCSMGKDVKECTCELAALLTEMKLLPQPESENSEPHNPRLPSEVYISWNHWCKDDPSKTNMPFFAHQVCKDLNKVSTPNCVASLFDRNAKNVMVVVSHDALCPFLILITLMYKCKRISCRPKSGLMLFLGRHIKAPENEEKYKPENFRMIKLRAMANPIEKQNIKEKIWPIFKMFCYDEASKTFFENYFQ